MHLLTKKFYFKIFFSQSGRNSISYSDAVLSPSDSRRLGRAMSCIADVLGVIAGSSGGLRSGPAANSDFAEALALLHVSGSMAQLAL